MEKVKKKEVVSNSATSATVKEESKKAVKRRQRCEIDLSELWSNVYAHVGTDDKRV